ncbi:hypothetical protein LAZ67_5003068 [Cordylochernes scorpioides]|uniref:Uncharacterized protein n=1 Tax=Cordylochernes scorpioides TaxID=51811 RepID=A0ABY6KH02_9ARAC|nr:hypothetical protein LAZ67_5003068 [Cordylochernes scorpioides]
MDSTKALLKRYEEEGDHFLDQIVTGDECWCYHYDPSTKRASMEWKGGDPPRPKKKNQKNMLQMDSTKALLKRYEEEGDHFLDQIVTGDECWCYHYDPSTKRASMEWKGGDPPRPKKKNQVSTFGRESFVNNFLGC